MKTCVPTAFLALMCVLGGTTGLADGPQARPPSKPLMPPQPKPLPPADPVRPSAQPDGPVVRTTEDEFKQFVVMIRATLAGNPVVGAGVIVGQANDRLYVATANHVVRDFTVDDAEIRGEDIKVLLSWLPGESVPATLLNNFDRPMDLAVLAVPGASGLGVPKFAWAILVRPETLAAGEKVFPVGYPSGMPWFVPRQPHVVSSVTGQIIRTEGDLTPGHSGGALATEDWGLTGIVRRAGSLLGEAMRIDIVVQQLREWGYPVAGTYKERATTSNASGGDPASALSRERQAVEGLVGGWVGAMMARDATTLLASAEVPFYFDQEILGRREDLESRFKTWMVQDPPPDVQGMKIQRIHARTLAELRAEGGAERDRVINSLHISDSDWRVEVTITSAKRTEGIAFFVRKVGGVLKIVGFWD